MEEDEDMEWILPSRRSHMSARARYIPLRLQHKERKRLHILEASLNVSRYTDVVDTNLDSTERQKFLQLKSQLIDISAFLTGIFIAADYKDGQELLKDKDFAKHANFFREVFEVGRRHKIMNPEKMRTEYGKLVFLLQDSLSSNIKDQLGFSVKMGIKTVYGFLKAKGALKLLEEPDIEIATREILQDPSKSRYDLQKEIKKKEKTVKELCAKYKSREINEDEIKFCLYSLTDNNSFLNSNALPIQKMLTFLTAFFKPNHHETGYSLEIKAGEHGARLSHTHEKQFQYVHQSLTLWLEIMENMFMLWFMAENDLLNEGNPPLLSNTGQGIHRVQPAPLVERAMHAILAKVQSSIEWVGSSVVHLGDHNVPNALVFIDKYTQVPRILVPIVTAIEGVDKLIKQPTTKQYIDKAFGGADKLKKDILVDFFRFGFDGSGADNFIDAGSCIDGRLTSAWNWCSQLETKPFYPIFLLSGFTGFDGDFQK
uniref:Non-canonical E2 ubiquitin-conjugating enzyme C-terminal domain-containing protein n=1 Tax=Arcella intermedia TaxID=1963864 RepID=A0A6B2L2U4_9EUKA